MAEYRVRYFIDPTGPWDVGAEELDLVMKGVRCSEDDFGYCDEVLICSCMRDKSGKIGSVLLLGSEDGRDPRLPSRELLTLIRDQIDHHLQEHSED